MLGLTLNYKQLKIIHQIRAESQSLHLEDMQTSNDGHWNPRQ